MGMAERIKNTVFPVTYRVLLHLVLYIFVITLSIALDGVNPLFEIPLLLSLDFRPEIGFGDDLYNNNDLDFDIALGIRYQF